MRMMNTSEKVDKKTRTAIINKWTQKLINSSHSISGLKGYHNKDKKKQLY